MSEADLTGNQEDLQSIELALELVRKLQKRLVQPRLADENANFRKLSHKLATLSEESRQIALDELLRHLREHYRRLGVTLGVIRKIEIRIEDRIELLVETKQLYRADIEKDLEEIESYLERLRRSLQLRAETSPDKKPPSSPPGIQDTIKKTSKKEAFSDLFIGTALVAIDVTSIAKAQKFTDVLFVSFYFGYQLLKTAMKGMF